MQRLGTQQAAIIEPIVATAAAVILAVLIGFMMTAAPKTTLASAATQAADQSDMIAGTVKGAVCSKHAWPHFEQRCQFDLRNADYAPRAVRVLAFR